ncbi:MAG: J domain-containing protein [Pseudomonadota bacterium]
MHVSLPETQVLINGEAVILPRTCHKLDRYPDLAPWEQSNGDEGAPCEWKQQPFFPKVRGRWCSSPKATFYNEDAWTAYSHHITDESEAPKDIVLEQCAQVLGVNSDANRKQISAAFRLKVKQVHPDFGGTPDEFQKLLAARNTLLVKCSRV